MASIVHSRVIGLRRRSLRQRHCSQSLDQDLSRVVTISDKTHELFGFDGVETAALAGGLDIDMELVPLIVDREEFGQDIPHMWVHA